MKPALKRFLYWSPRILCLFFAAFISLFALDVFDEHSGFWNIVVALVIHLIPTWILLLILVFCWRWEWIGGVLFPALGLVYIVGFWGRFVWFTYALISGPLFLLGILFLLSWKYRAELRVKSPMPSTVQGAV